HARRQPRFAAGAAAVRELLSDRAHAVRFHAHLLRGDAAHRKRDQGSGVGTRRSRADSREGRRAGAVHSQSCRRAAGALARVHRVVQQRRLEQGRPDSLKTATEARRIIDLLGTQYPDADTELHYSNAFELLVATILSAQSTDARVNLVTPALFKRYPNAKALARASAAELEPQIRSTGFFRAK